MFEGNMWKNFETLSRNSQDMWEALQDYNLVSIFKKQVDCCKKLLKKNKKIENLNNNDGNEQVKNKKTSTNTRQCKSNNVGNEHDTSGSL
jgi:hypothetical protein